MLRVHRYVSLISFEPRCLARINIEQSRQFPEGDLVSP